MPRTNAMTSLAMLFNTFFIRLPPLLANLNAAKLFLGNETNLSRKSAVLFEVQRLAHHFTRAVHCLGNLDYISAIQNNSSVHTSIIFLLNRTELTRFSILFRIFGASFTN